MQGVAALVPLSSSSMTAWRAGLAHAAQHIFSKNPAADGQGKRIRLQDLTNTRIPSPEEGVEILAFVAKPQQRDREESDLPVLILIHEFFGLSSSIVEKAQALANDLGCLVVAPDTFRGQVTNFIPMAIWLALTTPQERVNQDLNAVCDYYHLQQQNNNNNNNRLAVMGFCYGGGKALRFAIAHRPHAATVVVYGNPVTNVEELSRLRAPVCGIFGRNDVQFPGQLLEAFQRALHEAGVTANVQIYNGVGHAFWRDMDQVRSGQEPQTAAYQQCTAFLRQFFFGPDKG